MEQQKRLIINELFSHMSTSDLIEKINKNEKKELAKEKNRMKSQELSQTFFHIPFTRKHLLYRFRRA